MLEAGNREGFNLKNVDDIVDAFEIADTYAVLNDAPTVRIGDNVFQNAMGDTMAHQQMNANQISARRSNKSAMQGIYSAHTRELLELQGGGPVRTYDFVDVPAAKRNDIFTEHWQQWQSPDPAKQRIFNIVFDTFIYYLCRGYYIILIIKHSYKRRYANCCVSCEMKYTIYFFVKDFRNIVFT